MVSRCFASGLSWIDGAASIRVKIRCAGGETFLKIGVEVGEALHRWIGHQQGSNKGGKGARRRGAGDDLATSVENDDRDGDAAE